MDPYPDPYPDSYPDSLEMQDPDPYPDGSNESGSTALQNTVRFQHEVK